METERIYLKIERGVLGKKLARGIAPEQVFSAVTVQSVANVYKETKSAPAVILYLAIVGNCTATGACDFVKLYPSFLKATGFDRPTQSKAARKLREAGFIETRKLDGNKLAFRLTEKGKKGQV